MTYDGRVLKKLQFHTFYITQYSYGKFYRQSRQRKTGRCYVKLRSRGMIGATGITKTPPMWISFANTPELFPVMVFKILRNGKTLLGVNIQF